MWDAFSEFIWGGKSDSLFCDIATLLFDDSFYDMFMLVKLATGPVWLPGRAE